MGISFVKAVIKYLLYLIIGISIACVPEEEMIISQPAKRLTFSRDTILFDTIFSTVESITRYLQVYNPNENAVNISSVELAGGHASAYQLYVNGRQETRFNDLQLLGGDSLLILVEMLINHQDKDLPFLVEDSVLFTTGSYAQNVKLIAWGQDAHFLKGLTIERDTTFTNDRPYVIYDSLWVAQSATLRIEAGAQVYFNTGASLLVDGTLLIEGTSEEKVLLRSSRRDRRYAYQPGQWKGIFFSESSKNSAIDHAIVRNAITGISIHGNDADTVPDVMITNTRIRNMANFGIDATDADINAYNLLIDSCASSLVRHIGKGYSWYVHCTFHNSYARGVAPALYFTDTSGTSSGNTQAFELILKNNIIWGGHREELIVVTEKADVEIDITSNLIKTGHISDFGKDNLLNEDPQFINIQEADYRLDAVSAAIDAGIMTSVKKDIDGHVRDSLPDLGAYEYSKE